MRLDSIEIDNFKNIAQARLDFSPGINAFIGNNAMGKSNLLDAIYMLSYCRSFNSLTDAQLILHGAGFFSIRGHYSRATMPETLTLGLNAGSRKVLKRKGKEYKRLAEHIGQFPLVISSPADGALLTGAAEQRRTFVDIIISQANAQYLDALLSYRRALDQRNKLLRAGVADNLLYEAIENTLCAAAATIHRERTGWLPQFNDIFAQAYNSIASTGETATLTLNAHLGVPGATMPALLDQARRRDSILGHTTVGPHRDDLAIAIDGIDARHTASQGQAKTITIALRLAQFHFLRQATGLTPLLLLDDIFDRLDSSRVKNIIELVRQNNFGQIFITDTDNHHLRQLIAHAPHTLWQVENGRFTTLNTL